MAQGTGTELSNIQPEKRQPDRFQAHKEKALAVIRDVNSGRITEEEGAQKIAEINVRLEEQTGRDRLTGIANRQGIMTKLGQEIAHAIRGGADLSVAFIDLDGLGRINKEKGHHEGNRAIKEMAKFLKSHILRRETDSIGRLGGDEFLLVCPFTSILAAKELAEAIRENLILHMRRTGFEVTASIGLAAMRDDNRNVVTLIKEADSAQRIAKLNGKNRVEISPPQS